MKTVLYFTLLLLGILSVMDSHSQIEITSFQGNGIITWAQGTNDISSYTIEWASSPDGPWLKSWDSLVEIFPTNGTMSATIPMFFRVVGQQVSRGGHLLLSEVVVAPTSAEFVEIYNNTGTSHSLDHVYLSDYNTYYMITQGLNPPASSDFRVRFPEGTVIPNQARVVVSLHSATNFYEIYGSYPDFDCDESDTNAPAMTGEIGATVSLSNTREMLVLFYWDGVDEVIYDIDYLVWGNTQDAMDKTGVSSYFLETAVASQDYAPAPASGQSLERTDMTEGVETRSLGNGVFGHDETSENFSATWQLSDTPSPGQP